MRSLCLAAAAAACAAEAVADAAPPVITLDLDGVALSSRSAATENCVGGNTTGLCVPLAPTGTDYCHSDTGLCVRDRVARECEVGPANASNCGLPIASVYDHHDEASEKPRDR